MCAEDARPHSESNGRRTNPGYVSNQCWLCVKPILDIVKPILDMCQINAGSASNQSRICVNQSWVCADHFCV